MARPPRVGDKTVKFKIKASDNAGLAALICFQRGGEWIDAMVGDVDFEGKKSFNRTLDFTCPRPLGKSQPVLYWVNIADVNGNLSQKQIPPTRLLPK